MSTERPPQAATPPVSTPPASTMPLRRRRLLLLEQPDVQLVIHRGLQNAGASVFLAFDAHGAIRQAVQASANGGPFDAILLPMTIEPVDGYAAARVLRQKDVKSTVLGLVDGDLFQQRQSCLDAGCTDVAARTDAPDALVEALRRHLPPPAPGPDPDPASQAADPHAAGPAQAAPGHGSAEASSAPALDPDRMEATLAVLIEQLDQQSDAMRLRTIERIERLVRAARAGAADAAEAEDQPALADDPQWQALFADTDRIREQVDRWINALP